MSQQTGVDIGEQLPSVVRQAQAALAPLWPLEDFVAVNPFLGLSGDDFLTARQRLRAWTDAEMLMPVEYFGELWSHGRFTSEDLAQSLHEVGAAHPALFADFDVEELIARLEATAEPHPASAPVSPREAADPWRAVLVEEITKHCERHYDQGQALWPSPWKNQPLYTAWREAAVLDLRMDRLGAVGFRERVAHLPVEPLPAIAESIEALGVAPEARQDYFTRQLYAVKGWASYIKYLQRDPQLAETYRDDLTGLLAICVSYDAALVSLGLRSQPADATGAGRRQANDQDETTGLAPREAAIRYILQGAVEIAYRRQLLVQLTARRRPLPMPRRRTAQLVFCIDVRSEPLRRCLEAVSDEIETFGFAGFFGMPIEYRPLGGAKGRAQCPVLLTPSVRIAEGLPCPHDSSEAEMVDRRLAMRTFRRLWTGFTQWTTSGFTFVETLGWLAVVKLVSRTLGLQGGDPTGRLDGVPNAVRPLLGPQLRVAENTGLAPEQRLVFAENMLRKLGLTEDFARLVVLCGHGSQTVNNPYQASLDCGACGGHSGEPNARLAAALLNDASVRQGLASRGITIPEDTWFLAALHNTTTDEITYFDEGLLPAALRSDFANLREWTQEAGRRNRADRALRLGAATPHAVWSRSRDWSEVRPEWGLAGNAAFIAAPRARTQGCNLRGRAFLHSYEHATDHDLSTLELILTAPVVVANWINLQYYASTVDNRAFGSGNKVLHNVVGKFAVVQGNGGDLMTGLPWQSVHDGRQLQHEPLRLLVVVEAPCSAIGTILNRHPAVRDLATNGWLHLVALDSDRAYRFNELGEWEAAVDRQLAGQRQGDHLLNCAL
ncbi:MAG: DUF2309 domain-containing protein [Pirellulales bacterium]|nr:DUF2309 domain-containing protein [Pirellulales bacterium]